MPLTPQERDLLSSGKISAIDLLSTKNTSPLDERLELILLDLRVNYSKHQRKVEDYLSVVPELATNQDLLIRIIVEEFTVRVHAGDSPKQQEYIERFPQFESILEKFLVDEKLRATTSLPTQAADPQVILASRYKLVGEPVGAGAFGSVYLGLDLKLNRPVAVKLSKIGSADSKTSNYQEEARMLAKFQHPNIVSIYDVGSTDEGQIYIVSQFVRGGTLKSELDQYRGNYKRIADTLASVAEALQFAHDRKIIHRDIKPANVLIDKSSKEPLLADFGLAITEEDLSFTSGAAGTPAYMSPEQIRGEGHRLDGRTDIFSLGVVLYELLTGQLPFQGSQPEMLKRILQDDPPPPSSIDPNVPLELERICLKALSKQPSDRYAKASTMAQELRSWDAVRSLATEEDANKKITPKGLRSFDEKDAGYFLSLLPGPRNREGLPESIAFWKEKIEQRDPDKTFTVGLIYGPSGCGKSSLVKAGLIPNLSQEMVVIYVEATAEDTEGRLLRQLRKRMPDLSEDLGFAETLSKLRRYKGRKVVLIIDQFEQWLYSHTISSEGEFERGLRQCDGARIQAVLMIRDDFYLAAARLMNQIDVPILTDENFRLVDLFDKEHAKKVLTRFGQAYDKLPSQSESISQQQTNFVQGVIDGLSEGDKVVSVRIALIADILKNREWVPTTLEALGGLDGIGVEFLEETFASNRADVRHRTHQVAVRGILKALLPDLGTQIKGGMRSEEELKEASGYRHRPTDFTEVVRVLDRELRLITPTDPSGESRSEEARAKETGQRYYQLTHDYLVPSLRQWLTHKQRETKKGRAELKLAERAVTWGANQENKQLPTLREWMQIHRWTDKTKWNKTEAQLMADSNRFHGTRIGLLTSAVALLIASAIGAKSWIDQRETERAQDALVALLQSAEMQRLPDELNKVSKLRPGIDAKLEKAIEATSDDTEERLKLHLALLGSSPKAIEYVASKLPDSEAKQVPVLISALQPYAGHLKDKYWSIAEERNAKSLLPIASALAVWDPTSDRWAGVSSTVVDQLVKENPLRVGTWIETLRPAKGHLLATLQQMVLNQRGSVSPSEKDLALDMLESYAQDLETLHELIVLSEPKVFARFFPKYQTFQKQALEKLQQELIAKVPEFDPDNEADPKRLAAIDRQANAAVALLRLEDPKPVYDFLTVDRDPEALSQFIYRIRGREVSPTLLIKSFNELRALTVPDDFTKRQQHYYRLYGMILGLGEYRLDKLPSAERDGLLKTLATMYAEHPSRTIHSAVGWLLRRWGQDESVRAVEEKELAYDATGAREWYVIQVEPPVDFNSLLKGPIKQEEGSIDLTAPIYFTMLVYPGGEFEMGLPGEQQRKSVPGTFAVSDREVTWRQFSAVDDDTHRKSWEKQFQQQLGGRDLHPDEPVFGVGWFDAVNYCRWLTESKMPGEKNQCYAKKDLSGSDGKDKGWVSFPSNTDGAWDWPMNPKRGGFRLLTEAEWECVARGGMETRYSFGSSESLLAEHGWFMDNSAKWSHRTQKLRPSIAGVFDIHGNMSEWVDDWYTEGSDRVIRGGSWDGEAAYCRSAYRGRYDPSYRNRNIGFRLALSPSGIPQSPEADK